jgi:hypothetical protein
VKVALTGFAPDLDPATEGVVSDCDAMVPTMQGLFAANSLVTAGQAELAEIPTSAYTTTLLDGSKRLFAASSVKIYEASGGTWTLRSRAGNYSGTEPQSFTVFGNIVLNANKSEPIGQASPGGNFADIATAPKAAILCTASGFVMALNTNDATFGDRPDGWWCSGLRDQTIWTPSAATQSANGRLIDSPGAISAGAALGDDVVAYKATSMYLGRYVGPPLIWQWAQVPGEIGCASKRAVVAVDTSHYFIGPNDFFVFDGTFPRPLDAPLREWFFADLNAKFQQNIIGALDRPRSHVYWYYPSKNSTSGALDSLLIYNFRTNAWGKRSISVATPVLYVSATITYDSIVSLFATYNDMPNIAYDSPFWLTDQTFPAVFQGTALYSLTGTPGASFVKTGSFGDETGWSFLRRVSPRFVGLPTTGTAVNFYRETLGHPETQDATSPLSRNRFDFRRSSRWHSIKMSFTGPVGINGLDVEFAGVTKE